MRFLALMSILALSAAPAVLPAAEQVCDRSDSKSTPSPDGQWIANVQEEVCSTPTGAAAGITVVIASAQDPAHSKRVFLMPVPRSRDDWPRIRWQGAKALQVRVANLSEASPPEAEFEGIQVSLAYCGDNPADRERLLAYKASVKQWQKDVGAWVQKRKQDAETAGPMPPRPEEPLLAPGRCVD
jgi:hypothetical protein